VKRYRRKKANIVQAIKRRRTYGYRSKDELETISERAQELEAKLAAASREPPGNGRPLSSQRESAMSCFGTARGRGG